LTEGEGERATVTPLFSIPEILDGVKPWAKRHPDVFASKVSAK